MVLKSLHTGWGYQPDRGSTGLGALAWVGVLAWVGGTGLNKDTGLAGGGYCLGEGSGLGGGCTAGWSGVVKVQTDAHKC